LELQRLPAGQIRSRTTQSSDDTYARGGPNNRQCILQTKPILKPLYAHRPCSVSSYSFADFSHQVGTLYFFSYVVMYVRYRYIIDFHPICYLRPFFFIPPTYRHPVSHSKLFIPLPDVVCALGFYCGNTSVLRCAYTRWAISAVDSTPFYCIYCANPRLVHLEIRAPWFNAKNRSDTLDHAGL